VTVKVTYTLEHRSKLVSIQKIVKRPHRRRTPVITRGGECNALTGEVLSNAGAKIPQSAPFRVETGLINVM